MQVTYQQRMEDWIAAQIFAVEQLSSLAKQDKKVVRNLVIYLIAMDLFMFVVGGPDGVFWFFTLVFILWIGFLLFNSAGRKRKMIYQRLLVAYGAEFEKEQDKTVDWDISPNAIVIADKKKESRFQWEGVRRIVVCPDYLFIDFGGITGWLSFPGGAVAETVYQAFCEEVIRTYREHAARAGKIADVIHSEWAIDFEKLKKASQKFSIKRIIFTLLWGLAFLVVGFLFLFVAELGLTFAAAFIEAAFIIEYDSEVLSRIFAAVAMAGSMLFWLAGIVLGLFGKLPGTRAKQAS